MGGKTYNGGGTVHVPGTWKDRDTGLKDDPDRPQDLAAGSAYAAWLKEKSAREQKARRDRRPAKQEAKVEREAPEYQRNDNSLTLLQQGTDEWERANGGLKSSRKKKINGRKSAAAPSSGAPKSGRRPS